MTQKLKKILLLTGGNSGLGRSIAFKAAASGYSVCLTYHTRPDEANLVCSEIGKMGGSARAFRTNISSFNEVKQLFEKLREQHCLPNVLVNNAGISGDRKSFLDFAENEVRAISEVNFLGTMFCCQEALKEMVINRRGVIINISSFVASSGGFKMAAYAASKGAVETLTKSLANEFGEYGIRTNCIAPGVIETKASDKIGKDRLNRSLQTIPLGRFGTPEEVAEAAIWLASDESSYINGASLPLTGGKN